MTDDRRALLRRRLRAQHGATDDRGADGAAAAPRHPAGTRLPLTHAQRRMWLPHRMAPDAPTYTVCLLLSLRGAVREDLLLAAFDEVVARHEILRTTYGEDDAGEPFQVVHDRLPPVVHRFASTVVDQATDRPAEVRAPEPVRAWAQELAAQAFDLTSESSLRLGVAVTGPEALELVLLVHHIAWDGATFGVLSAELTACYRALTEAGAPPPPPRVQYADLAWREHQHGSDPHRDADETYWRGQLTPFAPPLNLPLDRPFPAVWTGRGARTDRDLAPAAVAALRELGRPAGATPAMVFQAALAACLHRVTGDVDLCLGAAVLDREHPDTREVIGNVGNTVVLRVDLSGDPSFTEVLARVRAVCEQALAHRSYPFDVLVEQLAPPRDRGRPLLFDVLSLFLTHDITGPQLRGVEIGWEQLGNGFAAFPLSLEVFLHADGARVEATRSVEVFDAPTVDRVLDQLESVLTAASRDPHAPLSQVSALPFGVRAWLDAAGTGPAVPPELRSIPEAVAAVAAAAPDAVAVRDDDRTITYRTFTGHVAQLARRLHALTASGTPRRAESVVAVAVPRGRHAPTALLAVLEAGAVYLPCDLAHPPQRLRDVLTEARPTVLVTAGTGPDVLGPAAAEAGIALLDLDDPAEVAALAASPTRPLDDTERGGRRHADDPAYLIYTSGSTGRPKGVLVGHRALAAQLHWACEALPLAPDARVLQKTAPGFDVALWELLWPLVQGAALVTGPPGAELDPGALADELRRHRITDAIFVPSLLRVFLDDADGTADSAGSTFPELRRVLAGGEAMTLDLAARFRDRLRRPDGHPVELINVYGPAETTCAALTAPMRPTTRPRPPIGTPVGGTTVHVLDDQLTAVAPGVVGELYLAGVQLARGYRDAPARTAERFVADPGGGGARLYRTGDRVLWNPDGELEYIGRTDDQVKVRGQRIEIGEVEAALTDRAGVAAAAVVLTTDTHELVAFVVAEPGHRIDPAGVRAELARVLPAAWVPSRCQVVAALPVTANGKLDRSALPTPDPVDPTAGRAPAGPTETAVAELVADALGLPAAGADTDFFAHGGHSVLATRLVSRIRARLGVDVGIAAVFSTPTVAGIAAAVDAAASDPVGADVPAPRTVVVPDPAPLSFGQRWLWLLHQLGSDPAEYTVAVALHLDPVRDTDTDTDLDADLDPVLLTLALRDVVTRHAALRTVYRAAGDTDPADGAGASGEPVAVVLDPAQAGAALRITRLPDADPATLEAFAAAPFDLAAHPPLRVGIAAAGAGRTVLVVAVHHIACDEVTLALLIDDLAAAYRRRDEGAAPDLATPPTSYVQYACWQRTLLGDRTDLASRAAAELRYWTAALHATPRRTRLPDRPQPVPTGRPAAADALVQRTLPGAIAAGVTALARSHHTSPLVVFGLAAAVALHAAGADRVIPFGCPVDLRTHPDLEGVAGSFVNTVVLPVVLAPAESVGAHLGRTAAAMLAGLAHRHVPFGWVVDALAPPREDGLNPLFQVLLAHSAEPSGADRFADLTVRRRAPLGVRAKVDLTLGLHDLAGGGWGIGALHPHDRFAADAVESLLDAVTTVLARLPDVVDAPLTALLAELPPALALPAAPALPPGLPATADS